MSNKFYNQNFNSRWFLIIGSLLFFCGFSFQAFGGDMQLAKGDVEGISIKEKQVVEINQNLKNVIEENQRLASKNEELAVEIKRLKSEHMRGLSQLDDLKKDKDKLAGNIREVKAVNRRYSKRIESLEGEMKTLAARNQEYSQRTQKLEEEMSLKDWETPQEEQMLLAAVTDKEVMDRENKTLDLLSKIDAFAEEDERLRQDAAKAHYNMGNIYYQKGEYEIAAREYYQAVVLMPDDPDAHYNLAFVSARRLKDYKTALKHYQIYLYLSPEARDTQFVKEQIIDAKLRLEGKVDSPLEKRVN